MNFVEWKATAAKSKHSNVDFARLKQQFLADVVTTAEMEIPAELILNRDQTGIKIVPFSTWTMDAEGSKWVEVATTSTSSQQCSVVHSLEISYRWKWYTKAKPIAAIPTTSFLQIGILLIRPSTNKETMVQYVDNIVIPYVAAIWAEDKPALIIMDFKGQKKSAVPELMENIRVVLLAPNTTDPLQPMEVSVNKLAKDFLKRQFEE